MKSTRIRGTVLSLVLLICAVLPLGARADIVGTDFTILTAGATTNMGTAFAVGETVLGWGFNTSGDATHGTSCSPLNGMGAPNRTMTVALGTSTPYIFQSGAFMCFPGFTDYGYLGNYGYNQWHSVLQTGFPTTDLTQSHTMKVSVSGEATTTPEWWFQVGLKGVNATTTPPAPTGPSSVLFLPGIESSRLYEDPPANQVSSAGIPLWEPHTNTPVGELALDSVGASINPNIYTKDVLDEAYGHFNVYKSFLEKMESLKTSGGIADFKAVPYDWRLSLDNSIDYGKEVNGKVYYTPAQGATSTPYLLQEFTRLVATSTSHKVTVVAHSNGGLLLKQLLIRHPELNQYVDKIVFVDVPQVGTPQALGGLLHADNQGLPIDNFPLLLSRKDARSLANNFPMTYNLLPSESYFTYVDDPVATFDQSTLPDYVARYGTPTVHSSDRMNAFITDAYQKVVPDSTDYEKPTTGNTTLLVQAQNLHQSIDTWTPASTTQLIQIAGWGVPSTMSGLQYHMKSTCVYAGITCIATSTFEYVGSTTIDGDGTVVTPSQLWVSQNLPNVKNYWANLRKYNNNHRVVTLGGENGKLAFKHANILEVPDVLSLLTSTVSSTTQTSLAYLSQTKPTALPDDSFLHYTLHSPLTLDLYDSYGNHTGISTTTGEVEEGIPGTYYAQFGDVKHIFTDATTTSMRLYLNGYATSTFTLNVDQVSGDSITASTTFKDIPVTPNTRAGIATQGDITTLSPLSIDLGDGIQRIITPSQNGTATLDLAPPEILLGFSTSTNSLYATSTDDSGFSALSSSTEYPILKKGKSGTATTTLTAVDGAGNTTVLIYSFKYPTKERRIILTLGSLSYNGIFTPLKNTKLSYKWALTPQNTYKTLASYAQTQATTTETHYRPKKNQTAIMTKPTDLDDDDEDSGVDVRTSRLILNGVMVASIRTKSSGIQVIY